MPKRLQVIFENAEYRQLQKAARRARLTVSALVRQTLRDLHGNASPATAPASPPVVREPGRHRYAVAGRKGVTIEMMNEAIAEGATSSMPRRKRR